MNILEFIDLNAKLSKALVEKDVSFSSRLRPGENTCSFFIVSATNQIDAVINPATQDCQVVVWQLSEIKNQDVVLYSESHTDTDLDRIVELILAVLFPKHF